MQTRYLLFAAASCLLTSTIVTAGSRIVPGAKRSAVSATTYAQFVVRPSVIVSESVGTHFSTVNVEGKDSQMEGGLTPAREKPSVVIEEVATDSEGSSLLTQKGQARPLSDPTVSAKKKRLTVFLEN